MEPPHTADCTLLEATLDDLLPPDYVAFLRSSTGGEGFLGEKYACLWRAEELIEFNGDHKTTELALMFFLI